MQKIFVNQYVEESVDDYPEKEQLQVVKIYPGSQRPSKYNYIVFMEKGNK